MYEAKYDKGRAMWTVVHQKNGIADAKPHWSAETARDFAEALNMAAERRREREQR